MTTNPKLAEKGFALPRVVSRLSGKIVRVSILALGLAGIAAFGLGIWLSLASGHDETGNTSAAMYTLLDTGSTLEADIESTVRPAMQRTEILAKSPEIIRALATGDRSTETAVLNSKITTSTEIDAIALFNASGRISAINTVYANGEPIPDNRVNRVLGADFSGRDIIQSCLRNNINKSVLEFQTHCDITPAFFDSTGLSVAYSVPVMNENGVKLGVISSRLSFDRLSRLIEGRTIGGGSARAYFITDAGGYFSETINSGKEQPPIPVSELRDIVRPILNDPASKTVTKRAADFLAIFSLPEVQTLDGGGIHILIVADGRWLMQGPRQDRLVRAAGSGLIGALLLIVSGLGHGTLLSLRAKRELTLSRDEARESELKFRELAETVHEVFWICDPTGTNIHYISPAYAQVWGRSCESLYENPRSFAEAIVPDDRPRILASLETLAASGIDEEYRITRPDGTMHWIHARSYAARDEAGLVKRVVGIAEDITDRRKAEDALWQAHAQLELRVEARTAELQQANESLRQSEADLQRAKDAAEAANQDKSIIFDTALDAIVTIDTHSIITAWNLQAETMFRWDRTEAVGMRLDETIIPQRQWEAHRREIEKFVKTGDGPLLSKVVELVALRRDGREFPIELAITPASTGGQCTFTAFIRDITVRKQAEIDLRQARDAAENASRAKSEFLANMSHEIRTPLNGVIGMSDLLLDTGLDEKQRRFAELIKSSGTSLADLINDILDFSKIEARKLEIESVDFDLFAAVEDVMETMLIKATPKGLELACLTLPDVPRQVKGDPQRVKQILINLVNNAIKFTESGSISTRLTLDNQSQECVTVRFSVTDTGIGIPADRMDRLFKSFSQVDASTTRSFGGTGLGLAISKQLAELMGGSIGVESKVGNGSTFWFTIKLGLAPEIREPAVATDGRGLRVLAVQRDAAMRKILHDQLCSWQLKAAVASSGDEAMSMLNDAVTRAHPYDVAIIDSDLPDIDALELGRAIKTSPELAGTVLLILLPWGSDFDPLKLRKAGFSNHLLKPVRQSRLYNSIMDAISATSQTKRTCTERTPIIGSNPNQTENGAPPVRILIAEDNRVNQIVATEVLTKHGYTCAMVDNGSKAVTAVLAGGYDLVLMDCSMPGMDGFEATRQIRRAEKADPASPHRHIPIIALTANAIKGDRDLCLEAGMDDYVSKPLDPQRLVKTIQMLLVPPNPELTTQAVIEAPAATLATSPTIAGNVLAPIAIDALLDRCMGNVETVASILNEFERQAVDDLAQIKQRVEGGHCTDLARVAHSLKGTAAILAADTLAGIAFKLERMGRAGTLVEQDQLLSQLNDEIHRCIDYLPTVRAVIAKGIKVEP